MHQNTCAVCEAEAPKDFWSAGWICVLSDGTIVSREDASGVPSHVVFPLQMHSCLVCSEVCLDLLVWRESHRPHEQIAAPF